MSKKVIPVLAKKERVSMGKIKYSIDLFFPCEDNDLGRNKTKANTFSLPTILSLENRAKPTLNTTNPGRTKTHKDNKKRKPPSFRFGSFLRINETKRVNATENIFSTFVDIKDERYLYSNFFNNEAYYYKSAGVRVHGTFEDEDILFKWMELFDEAFTPLDMKEEKEREELSWIVYSYPIIIIECGDCQNRDILVNRMADSGRYTLEEYCYKNTLFYLDKNLIIYTIIPSKKEKIKEIHKDIKEISLAIIFMKQICGSAKWEYTKAIKKGSTKSNKEKEQALDDVRIDFENFEAILSDELFVTRTKQDFYITMYKRSGLNNDIKAVKATKNAISHENEKQVNKKTESINCVVFFTGTAGLLFSIFGFCQIYGSDFISFKSRLSPYSYFLLYIGITSWFVFFMNVYLYFFKNKNLLPIIVSSVLLIITTALLIALFIFLGGGIH